jgi:hypothetical protein
MRFLELLDILLSVGSDLSAMPGSQARLARRGGTENTGPKGFIRTKPQGTIVSNVQ